LRTKQTDIETYLTEYYYAVRALKRLSLDFIAAQREYNDGVETMPGHGFDAILSKNKPITNPTQKAAIALVESLGKEVERITRSIADNEATIASITAFVSAAGLDGIEKEYVQYRYFENRSAENVGRLMGYEHTTVSKIRANVLDKLGMIKKRV